MLSWSCVISLQGLIFLGKYKFELDSWLLINLRTFWKNSPSYIKEQSKTQRGVITFKKAHYKRW